MFAGFEYAVEFGEDGVHCLVVVLAHGLVVVFGGGAGVEFADAAFVV